MPAVRLGTPNEGREIRNERLSALQRVETQINELRRMENPSRSGQASCPPSSAAANLGLLYHEAIPMDKALSHSGPSAFGNGLLLQQHPVSHFHFIYKLLNLSPGDIVSSIDGLISKHSNML